MSETQDFLFEIGCEELPAGVVMPMLQQLKQHTLQCFQQHGIQHGHCQVYGTPRRLALHITDVLCATPTRQIEKKGPFLTAALNADGQPTPAALGFAKACGVAFEDLATCTEPKGERLSHTVTEPGQPLTDRLPTWYHKDILPKLQGFKMMRWGSETPVRFPRPVHWVIGLLGTHIWQGSLLGCEIDRHTYGHRFHHPDMLTIAHPKDYVAQLLRAKVMVDVAQRRQTIKDQVQALTPNHHEVLLDDTLLDEVVQLVEWPQALWGDFDPHFLTLPAEALQAVMHHHQRCFLVRYQDRIAPHFVTVSNIESQQPKHVVQGNRKVMRARLSDAMFFFEQDQRQTLAEHAQALSTMVYQKQLGTLADKCQRLQTLAETLAPALGLDVTALETASRWCKADLATALVYEFPELHGAVGAHLAGLEGLDADIATAIKAHLQPSGGLDAVPTQPLAQALALMDRLDHLVGFFSIGMAPTGDKDPFGLRRAAIGVLRLCLALPKPLPLDPLIHATITTYPQDLMQDAPALTLEIKHMVFERLTAWCQSQDIPLGLLQGVRDRVKGPMDLQAITNTLMALHAFYQSPEAAAFTAAYKRLHQMTKALPPSSDHTIEALAHITWTTAPEQHLYDTTKQVAGQLHQDASTALNALHSLMPAIDGYFDAVMVMVDDATLRQQRLSQLLAVRQLCLGVADFAAIPYESLATT